MLTVVDDVDIGAHLITDWITEMGQRYNLTKTALDSFRYGYVSNALRQIGFSKKENKNVHIVQPSDIMKIVPVIDSCFSRHKTVGATAHGKPWRKSGSLISGASLPLGKCTPKTMLSA